MTRPRRESWIGLHSVGAEDANPFDEMPAFMTDLRSRESTSALALEYTILTAARAGETIGARWGEIDLSKKI